jgi:hypothetical protein
MPIGGLQDILTGGAGIVSWPAAAAPANGVSIAEVLRSLHDGQQGTAGIPTYPAAAAPANAVSMAEVLREIYDLGERVASNTGVDLTGGDVADVFTIAGGPIMLLGLWVDITTAVSANASLIHFESDPTVGASNTDIAEGTAAPDIQSAALGDVFHINGDSQDVMKKAANGTDLPMMENQNGGIYVPVGGIDMKLSTSDPTTGAATIWIRYKPLARGVTVT